MTGAATNNQVLHVLWGHVSAHGGGALLVRTSILAAGWWAITEGDRAALGFGVPVVLLALLTSLSLPAPPTRRPSPLGILRFAVTFLAGSVGGGLDVAWRAFHPRVPLSPNVVRYTLRLPSGPARSLFTGAVSMMPGTLSANLEDALVDIHVLVDDGRVTERLQRFEEAVARALAVRLETSRA